MSSKPPFERVVQRHGATVLRVCRTVVGADDADDAFLAALRAYPDLPGDANLEAWLVTIAHRKAIDAVRARARRAVPTAEPDPTRSPGPAADAAVDRGDPELYAALAQLTDRQRRAVAYHHVAGLPYAEVAQILGGSTDAVRRAAADGLARLRARLAPERTRP
jgi:RNA polymerase sigma factor (sigma-70 family)